MDYKKFYVCPHCGNIVEMVHDAGVKPFCCGQKMEELVPNTVEASTEKHVPAVKVVDNVVEVNVGSVDHPMVSEHWIEWVELVTDQGSNRKTLNPNDAPHVKFLLSEETPLSVYAYCNLHGLWKTDLDG